MKKMNLYSMALAVLAIFSCAREQEVLVPESESGMKFTAVWSDEASRTSLDENGTSVLWDPGDEIFIFQGVTEEGPSAMGKFTSTNTTRHSSATFTGTLEGECSGDYIAVYPYLPLLEYYGAHDLSEYGMGMAVAHAIAPVQQGVEGSFALKTAPAAAVSSTNELVFHNICSGVRFSVTRTGIEKITFSSVDESPMSGLAYILIGEDGIPVAMVEGLGGNGEDALVNPSFVEVVSPEGGFVPGKNYYAIMAPQTHAVGIKVTLSGVGVKAERILSDPITVKRAVFGKLDNIDAGLEFVSTTPVPEIVDLGLSVKWASCNLGATKPEEFGDYFAWGETDTKSHFTFTNYKWLIAWQFALKYTLAQSMYNIDPTPDNKSVLDLADDAAYLNLGGNWRMPTAEEFEELVSGCTWTEETVNGVQGMRVASNVSGYTDRSIFIPYAGGRDDNNSGMDLSSMNLLWSASNLAYPDPESYYAGLVCTAFYPGLGMCELGFRYWGLPVRPVYSGEVVHVTGVALNESILQIEMGSTAQLIATVTPEDASNKQVVWTSSDESIATVSEDGLVTGVGIGTAEITATMVDGGFSAKCTITVSYPDLTELGKTFVAVDLGLSVKWASFNLGATKPENYGKYYAWGETTPNGFYDWQHYKWCKNSSYDQLTKYCSGSYWGYEGYEDSKQILDPEDDAAFVALGGRWRIPTVNEYIELVTNCAHTRTVLNGKNGMKFISNIPGYTDQWIFLPAAGLFDGLGSDGAKIYSAGASGFYWSSSLYNVSPYRAWMLYHRSNGDMEWAREYRRVGYSIRPVCD